MRSPVLCALLAVVVAVTPVVAQPPAKKDEPKLKIGDPAPPLTVGKWHQGPEVKEFEKGKVYVVVFWGLVSGDSHALLRSVGAVHAKHKDVIPVAVGNSPDGTGNGPRFAKAEAEVVANAKPKYAFAIADDKGDATAKAYGVSRPEYGLYVVGKDGKVAFIAPVGDPPYGPRLSDFLPNVLPKVFDGSWKGQKDADAIANAEKEFQKALNITAMQELFSKIPELEPAKQGEAIAKQMTEMLKGVDDFLKTHPSFAGQSRTLYVRALLAVMGGLKDVATKAVDALVADATSRGVVSDVVQLASHIGNLHLAGSLHPEISADKLVGTIVDAHGLVVLSSAIFPEDPEEERQPAHPRDFESPHHRPVGAWRRGRQSSRARPRRGRLRDQAV